MPDLISGPVRAWGIDQLTGAALFILLLPTAIAAVMICWVLVGTHVQAFVRSGGVVISVFTGVLLTALVFALSMTVLFAGADLREMVVQFFAAGCVAAFLFFAVRDVYATIIVVTLSLVVLENSRIDPAYLVPFSPVVALCGILSAGALVGVHWHFSRHYTTILLRENNGFCWQDLQLRQDWRREDAGRLPGSEGQGCIPVKKTGLAGISGLFLRSQIFIRP